MKYAIGIDIGTSGTKAALYDKAGKLTASHTVEYPLYQPQNGYAEQNPSDWWEACLTSIKSILVESSVSADNVVGIGLSGQMHGLVMLDESGEVIRPSIIWCDSRTGAECQEITELVGRERLVEITANPAIAGFTAAKIMWVKKHEPENYKKTKHILLPKDYIRYKLTGEFATEVSDASGMQLLDIEHRCWSDEVLQKLDIDKKLLAKVYESPEITGIITKAVAESTGLKEGTPVVGGGGDNACAAVGTGVVEDNKAFTTIGTSGVLFAHTSKMQIDKKGRVHTFCSAVPNEWHVMGVTQAAGLSMKWLRDTLCQPEIEEAEKQGIDTYVLLDRIARDIPIGANKLVYLPYLMGERTPHLNPNARGVLFGLSAMHTKAEIIRAVLEGVSYSLRDCIEVLREMGVYTNDMMVCGGGAKSPVWRQMLADLYRCDVKTLTSNEGAALGAAILAFVGAGEYDTVQSACNAIVKTASCHPPIERNSDIYDKFYEVYKSIYPNLKDNYEMLAKI